MDDTTKGELKTKLSTLEAEFLQFSQEAQKELDGRNQAIQAAQTELQNRLRTLQTEIDKRSGAIETLRALTETKEAPAKPKVLPKPEKK